MFNSGSPKPLKDENKIEMAKNISINEEIVFYSNKVEQEKFKQIEKEIFQKLDQIPFSGGEDRSHKFEYKKESEITGSTRLIGTATEDHIKAVKNKIDEIRQLIEYNQKKA